MPTRCTRIKLRDGSSAQVMEWANELNRRAEEVRGTLRAEGVDLEAAFLDYQADGFYLIYIMHADDFDKAKGVSQQSTALIEAYHRAFATACRETRHPL